MLIKNFLWKSIIRSKITNDFLKDNFIVVAFFFTFTAFFNFNENTETIFKCIAEIFFVNFVLEKFQHLLFDNFKFKETVDAWSLFRIFLQ